MRTKYLLLTAITVTVTGCAWPTSKVTPPGITVISPKEATNSAITETLVRIHLYLRQHHAPPPDLAHLAQRKGYANATSDGWGRQLIYQADSDGVITLQSLGQDGKAGGQGEDADIVRRFRTKNADGSLNVDDEYWLTRAEIK